MSDLDTGAPPPALRPAPKRNGAAKPEPGQDLLHALQAMRELGWLTTQRRRIVVTDLEALRKRAI